MEQAVFLLILGAIAFIRWLYEKSQEAQARKRLEQNDGDAPARPTPQVSETERMRRFREALGLPEGEGPPLVRESAGPVVSGRRPPLPAPPPVPPAISPLTERLAAATRAREAAEREADAILRSVPAVKTRPGVAPAEAASRSPRFGTEIRRKLRDPRQAAESIVLGEILGPPRAFAPLQR